MTSSENINRRDALKTTLGTLSVTALGSLSQSTLFAAPQKSKSETKIVCFTKSFQDWSIPEVCAKFKSIGLNGLDLTVRSNGHIKPDKDDVAAELKKAHQAATEHGLEIPFLTTDITEPNARAERVLAAASEIGINKIKLGYFKYKGFGTLQKQLDEITTQLGKISQLTRKYNILPCVHIHSGTSLPSHGTMLYHMIKDYAPDEVGAYVDPLHMTLEGGRDGWRQGLDLLAPWIALCSVKNFQYESTERDKQGQLRWRTFNCPVADGIAPMPRFVQALIATGFNGPYSMHSEYKGRHTFKDLNTEECLTQTDADLKFMRSLLS